MLEVQAVSAGEGGHAEKFTQRFHKCLFTNLTASLRELMYLETYQTIISLSIWRPHQLWMCRRKVHPSKD